jgi:hypothetical protein
MDHWNKCGCEAAMIGGRILLWQKIEVIVQEAEKARNEKRNGGGERND